MLAVEAPAYIARSTWTSRWQVVKSPTQRGKSWQLGVATAAELAGQHSPGDVFLVWEFVSQLASGGFLFHRTRFVADAEGRLHGYDAAGGKKIIHPADRDVRYLGRV